MFLILFFAEASKVIMQYVAEVSGKGQDIDHVKEQLLLSNPVLEGNGNIFLSLLSDILIIFSKEKYPGWCWGGILDWVTINQKKKNIFF